MEYTSSSTLFSVTYLHWQRYPFVRLLPAFIIGIYLGSQFSKFPMIGLIILIIVGSATLFIPRLERQAKSFILHFLLLISGITLSVSNSNHQPIAPGVKQTVMATVLDDLEEKNKTYKTTIKIQYNDENDQSVSTKAIVYIQKTELANRLQTGDKILVTANFKPIQKPVLPGEFDYSKFLSSKGVFLSAYVRESSWSNTYTIDKSLIINRLASSKRRHFSAIIDKHVQPSSQPLVKAISIGQRAELESTTKTSFSKAGIMHILAVSGLHVGIIWSIISFVLAPLIKWKPSLKLMTFLIEVSCIWMFAFITGFAPSVQRAAFMFTIIAISKLNKYEKESVNVIIASAVMLLVFNPSLLFSVGFQLSYSAVLGITFLYPKIYSLIHCKYKFLDVIWKVQVVSLAAVIGTAPLSIYYFHQFSLIFPITNLIAIPAAYLLVIGSVCLFVTSAFSGIASFIGASLSIIGDALINSIKWISQLSFSSVTSLYINGIELFLVFLILILLGIVIYQFRYAKKLMITSLILINILCIYRGSRKIVSYQTIEHFSLEQKDSKTELLGVGNKLFILENINSESYPRNPSAGFLSNQLFYKNEQLITTDLNIADLLPEHKDQFATIEP